MGTVPFFVFDAVMELEKRVYILEFKMGTAEEALSEIKEKRYFEKYQASGKEILLIGAGFSSETRNLTHYLIETNP